ncbi:MAG TPA: HAMP domain-containing sensor histidine kinase [Polyangiaceae bacterium]|jgi:two-component system heavy metal sensor histidine kinase CusS|nr:HAMP domain-containing sensor histidine kinase [Polyangiaceae bacterium]
MTLHARLVTAVTVLSIVLLGVALSVVWLSVGAAQREQPDANLRAAAIEEAHEVAVRGGRTLTLGLREDDDDEDAAREDPTFAKYAVIYGPDGVPLAWTNNLQGQVPPLSSFHTPKSTFFDFRIGAEQARGILVDVPRHPGSKLLIGASRADIDREISFLGRALLTAFAAVVVFTALFAAQIVRRFTHGYEAIAAVTRRVADGDLTARVDTIFGSAELARLQIDINRMCTQLDSLFSSQRRFVAHAAHELRSPLTRLYGELSLALRRTRTPEEYRFTIEQALDATRRLKLLAEDLLELARLDAHTDEPWRDVSLAEVMDSAEQSVVGDLRSKQVLLDLRVPAVNVRSRRTDLERMLRNLLENAVRHSPAGDKVTVSASTTSSSIVILVADSGPGVAFADRPRVFEPFWRGTDQQASGAPGAGLGLAIARQIARAHGGDIELEESPSGGALFRITLPQSRPPPGPKSSEPDLSRSRASVATRQTPHG